jgi:hypothetical protein
LLTHRPVDSSGTASAGSAAGSATSVERSDPQVDLGHFEARDLDAEFEVEQR